MRILKNGDWFDNPLVPCLFQVVTNGVNFTLVVDNFGIKYQRLQDLKHLIQTTNKQWQGKHDISGSTYNGSNLEWDYDKLIPYNDPQPPS